MDPEPVRYFPKLIADPDAMFDVLQRELAWVRIGSTPRSEYYVNEFPDPYTYGVGRGRRTYDPQPWHPAILSIRDTLKTITNDHFDTCFLNFYRDQSDHLGWHADDSPEMDDARSIVSVSLGAERNIWYAPKDHRDERKAVLLGHGSALLMMPGMQDTHDHRIPKADRLVGARISLTFRGYVKATQTAQD